MTMIFLFGLTLFVLDIPDYTHFTSFDTIDHFHPTLLLDPALILTLRLNPGVGKDLRSEDAATSPPAPCSCSPSRDSFYSFPICIVLVDLLNFDQIR